MTYPVAGLYNAFLIKELGSKKYLKMYKTVNGKLEFIKSLTASSLTLPEVKTFSNYVEEYGTKKLIRFNTPVFYASSFNECGRYSEIDSFYIFKVFCSSMNLYPPYTMHWEEIYKYQSRLFLKITGKEYDGVIYLICVDSSFVKVYDCLSNELIFSYDIKFTFDQSSVPIKWTEITDMLEKSHQYYTFSLSRLIFDKKFSDYLTLYPEVNK